MNICRGIAIFSLAVYSFAFSSCQSFTSSIRLGNTPTTTQDWIWISEDPVLRDVLQERFEKDLFNRGENFEKIASVEVESIKTEILWGKSLLYSLATLTMGTFEKMESKIIFTVKYLDGIQVESKNFPSQITYDLRSPMPPYIGLGTTITLVFLDRYRMPENLRKYCVEEDPSRLREALESDKENYCKEYKKFLKLAWDTAEVSIDKDLKYRNSRKKL